MLCYLDLYSVAKYFLLCYNAILYLLLYSNFKIKFKGVAFFVYGTEQFEKDKVKTAYEKVTNTVDTETGEIIEQTVESIKTVQKEPNFVKVYMDTVLTFKGIKNISTDFLLVLCHYITYANDSKTQMRVVINKMVKDEMEQALGVKSNMIEKYIRKCVQSGILFKTEYRATYIVNAFLFARGEWKNIKSLRTEFDYINGSWKYVKRFMTDDEIRNDKKKKNKKEDQTFSEEQPKTPKYILMKGIA